MKVFKAVIRKLGYTLRGVGVTDCEGITNGPRIVEAVIPLINIARKLNTIIIVVDADDMDYSVKAGSIVDSLRSRGFSVGDVKTVHCSNQVFKTVIRAGKELNLVIVVNGIRELPFTVHEIEEHILQLLILEGEFDVSEVKRYSRAKEALGRIGMEEIMRMIMSAEKENVEKAFKHIKCCLEAC